jgi:hypothetical protein
MSFSKAKILHQFTNADGTPASGNVEFSLTKRMSNGNETITPSTVVANLSSTGELSVELFANTDPGTSPQDSQWRMTWRIIGSEPEEFTITVPTGGGTVQLSTLLPTNPLGG